MRSQRLFIAGLVLLLSLLISGCGGASSRGGVLPSARPSPLIVDSTLSTLRIEADIPPMEVKHQRPIAIAIYPTGRNGPVSEVPVVKNATAIVTNATPVGTPGSTLVDAFGPNHSVVATATLEPSSNSTEMRNCMDESH
jgi:hypothetical protein